MLPNNQTEQSFCFHKLFTCSATHHGLVANPEQRVISDCWFLVFTTNFPFRCTSEPIWRRIMCSNKNHRSANAPYLPRPSTGNHFATRMLVRGGTDGSGAEWKCVLKKTFFARNHNKHICRFCCRMEDGKIDFWKIYWITSSMMPSDKRRRAIS